MRLKNHIAQRLLSQHDILAIEMIETQYPELRKYWKQMAMMQRAGVPASEAGDKVFEHLPEEVTDRVVSTYTMLSPKDNRSYYLTNTVMDQLSMLKLERRKMDDGKADFNWKVFNHISDRKVTLIMPNNSLVRVMFVDGSMHMLYLFVKPGSVSKDSMEGIVEWDFFGADTITGQLYANNVIRRDVDVQKLVYTILCFMYLTKNDELILQPNGKTGTIKTGKILNEFREPLTIVTSRWNTTTIRTEGFAVRGHFAIRWTGKGRVTPELVFIEPFEKQGYVRQAASLKEKK